MKKPHATGRFSPVTPKPRFTIIPMAMAATSRISPRTVTTGQNQRGESRIDRSKSRLTSLVLRTLPSCIVVPSYSGFASTRYSPLIRVSIFWYLAPSFTSQMDISGTTLAASI